MASLAAPAKRPTSSEAAIKSRAFTLIELTVVCMILVIFATLIAPSVVHLRENQIARDVVPSVERLIGYARESSISKKVPVVMTYDSSTRTLTVKEDTTIDANAVTISANSVSQGAGTTPIPPTNTGQAIVPPSAPVTPDPDNPLVNKTLVLPSDFSIPTFQLAGKTVDEADFQLHFYTDGTSDGGGITVAQGANNKSLSVDELGRCSETDGDLPDPTTQKWEAGQFEPRQSATAPTQ